MVYYSCSLNLMFTVLTMFSRIKKKKKVGNKHGNRVFPVLIVFLKKKKKFKNCNQTSPRFLKSSFFERVF